MRTHTGPNAIRKEGPIPSQSQARVLHAVDRITRGMTRKVTAQELAEAVSAFVQERRWPGFKAGAFSERYWDPSESTLLRRIRDLRTGGLLDERYRPTTKGHRFLVGARGLMEAPPQRETRR